MSDPQLFDQDSGKSEVAESLPSLSNSLFGCYLSREQHIRANELIIDTVKTLIAFGERWLQGLIPDSVMVATSNYVGIQLQVFARNLAQESAISQAMSEVPEVPDDLSTLSEKDTNNGE